MKKLKPIMFVGTGSDVGKSVINAAMCRILLQDGFSPAPFKAQNMSLNSYATPDGLEIGRAQAVQAEACGLPCMVEMNPVLLKPTSDIKSQVVLNGKPIGNQTAKEYFLGNNKLKLFTEAVKAFNKLDAKFNPIVMEGAGSISELNLRDRDITNMRIAKEVDAATYLIADIDRGGVFASVYGTIELLPPDERKLIKGIIINKFRGDIDLFSDGKKILEEITGVAVVGILPMFRDIHIEEEDSVSLIKKKVQAVDGKINIGVVLLKHMSNFTDFDRFNEIPEVNLFFCGSINSLQHADIIIIPGSKSTISDMRYLWDTGIASELISLHKQGKAIYGVCGGYQIMGKSIHDPNHIEGSKDYIDGLGILPVTTTINNEKNSTQCQFNFMDSAETCSGYEIHMGTTQSNTYSPLVKLSNGNTDGYYLNNKTWGTYIHGIFDNAAVLRNILAPYLNRDIQIENYKDYKEKEYNKLADFVRKHLDIDAIYKHAAL